MALTARDSDASLRPRWPDVPFALDRSYMHYGAFADEPVLFFSLVPVASYVSGIGVPEDDVAAIMVGLGPDDEGTGEVVGIHVYPLLAEAARKPAHWRRLAEPDPPAELVAAFVAEVSGLFERYWRPAPPIDEQFARTGRIMGTAPDAPTGNPTP